MEPSWRSLNRADWHERVPLHLGPRGYDLSSHRAGAGRLDGIVAAELGPVAGLRVVPLQCRLGDDSVASAQHGATDVLEAPAVLPDEAGRFDLVFTSWGTICRLPDIAAWARRVAFFLRPGATLCFAEADPPGARLRRAGRRRG
jgi:hypothetical protein